MVPLLFLDFLHLCVDDLRNPYAVRLAGLGILARRPRLIAPLRKREF